VLNNQKVKLTFDFIEKQPPFIRMIICETQIDADDAQNLFENPNHVPTLYLQRNVMTNRNCELRFDPKLLELFYGKIQQIQNYKKPSRTFTRLQKNIIIDIDDSLGLILFCDPESTKLLVYKFFEENPFDIILYVGIDKPFEAIYTPDILKVIFIQCQETLCFIEKNGNAKFYDIKIKQPKSKTLEFPENTVNVLSSPN
ncbi:34010_t:CDS:2, partial [Racocetra persica]